MALRAVRMITLDVTGTMIKFKGHIGDIYCKAAAMHGNVCPDYDRLHQAFKLAYDETSQELPAFGGPEYNTKNWWRKCVQRSFDHAGFHFKAQVQENIFHNIYAAYGSHEAYEVFDDVIPFLQWVRQNGLIVGVVSNACERFVCAATTVIFVGFLPLHGFGIIVCDVESYLAQVADSVARMPVRHSH